MNQTRICNTCGIEKNIDLFCTDKRKPLGKTYKCKECRNNKDRVRIKEKRKNDTEWRDRYNTHSKRYHDKMKPIWKEQVIQDRLDKAIEDNASSSVFIRECNDCGVFDVFRQEPVANPNYCRECYYKYRNLGIEHKVLERVCTKCNTQFTGKREGLCPECKTEHKKEWKRIYNRVHGNQSNWKERAAKYGVQYERFSKKTVFDAANWMCELCGTEVIAEPKQDNSAELDHIKPISIGGDHILSNVQCLCRKCNREKGNHYADELVEYL